MRLLPAQLRELACWILVLGTLAAAPAVAAPPQAMPWGVPGGLCVQLGGDDLSLAIQLGRTGRFLVQVLDNDAENVQRARRQIREAGLYGLVSVGLQGAEQKLPYTEDLVNLLVITKPTAVPVDEMRRVLCPEGVVATGADLLPSDVLSAAGLVDEKTEGEDAWRIASKPRPAGMDGWTHAHHSAAGNAVSGDTLVGPPRRVRWVVAPQSEVPGMVTAGGRNFYAGVLARDSFNGLRLWDRDLLKPDSEGPLVMKNLPSNVPMPVAAEKYVFGISQGKLCAWNSATGEMVRAFSDAGTPGQVLHENGLLVVADAQSVRALDAESGDLMWRHDATAPQHLVLGEETVGFIQGDARRGDKLAVVALDKETGKIRWGRDDFPWAGQVYRCVYYQGLLAFEVSSLNDDGPGNALHVVSAADGHLQWEKEFLPGMNHRRQARAMFVADQLWILHGGKDAEKKRLPIQCSAIDPHTGYVHETHPAGLTHCFPPVATPRYMFGGEMNLTDLSTGQVDAHHITKAACGRESGWVPANGLVYVTPKHCVCWPMLRGYAALASERPQGSVGEWDLEQMEFPFEQGTASTDVPATGGGEDWPCYRHDEWRSGSTESSGPTSLNTLWDVSLAESAQAGPIVADWNENPFVKGPITSPVVALGRVFLARPDVHEVVALDAVSGALDWRFTADGRVDTPPTIHKGLCLFGDKNGWVYCLRADNAQLVWKRRAAPVDERIVAYGQVESPWPVPGSVLVVDDVAYFAAGRQSLADGGILIFAVDPASGSIHWKQRLDTVPQKGFYACSGLEFDNFDLLNREGDGVAMSRWVFDRASGEMSIEPWHAFAQLNTGKGTSIVPRGCWTYAPRHQRRISSYTAFRPLVAFRDNVLFGCLQGTNAVYRRDFDLEGGETFDMKWVTGWAAGQVSRSGEMPWRSHRLAEKSTWKVHAGPEDDKNLSVDALVLAGDRLYLAASTGKLQVRSVADGKLIEQRDLPAPLWDGLAIAGDRLYCSTRDGQVLCLGEEK